MSTAKLQTNFENPNYTGYRYNGDVLTLFYTRLGKQKVLQLSGEPLAAALQEAGCIEGYEVDQETGDVMVLHTVKVPAINAEGNMVMVDSWGGEPLHVWMYRDFFTTEAKALCNIYEAKADEAMLKSHLADTLNALKLGGVE